MHKKINLSLSATLIGFSLSFCFNICLFLCVYLSLANPVNLQASEETRRAYLELIKKYPNLINNLGDSSKGEIEILLDPDKMGMAEKSIGNDVGLVASSKWGTVWVFDACKFPNGEMGVYGRLVSKKALESHGGVAVLPILPDGRIAVICVYRHPTRSWEIEIPRGMSEVGETIEATAKREVLEETGLIVDEVVTLGEISPDSGLTAIVVPVCIAKVVDMGESQHEDGEAIECVLYLTPEVLKSAFKHGYYECHIRGEKKQVPVRDSFMAYALLLYELRP